MPSLSLMTDWNTIYPWWIFIVVIVISFLLAWKAREIHTDKTKEYWEGKPLAWRLHQFWLNFFGSFIGWVLLVYLIDGWQKGCLYQLSLVHFLFFVLAVIAITGYLPFTLIAIIQSLSKLGEELIKKLINMMGK